MTLSPRKLTLDDIADLRAYEREREEFRAHIIALKKRRRISVGPVVTFVFENRDTMRFQIQEMARAETDPHRRRASRPSCDIYNPLIPEPGHLVGDAVHRAHVATTQLRDWLPRLVGIERSVVLRFGEAGGALPAGSRTTRTSSPGTRSRRRCTTSSSTSPRRTSPPGEPPVRSRSRSTTRVPVLDHAQRRIGHRAHLRPPGMTRGT